jgi:hypothetical protein
MTDHFGELNDLSPLLASLCDGALDDDGFAQLEQRLTKDPAARRWYLAYMDLHGELCWDYRRVEDHEEAANKGPQAEAGTAPMHPVAPIFDPSFSLHPVPSSSSFVEGVAFPYLVAMVVMCFALGVAAIWKVSVGEPSGDKVAPNSIKHEDRIAAAASNESVGRITGMQDCVWEETRDRGQMADGIRRNLGSPVALGDTFSLRSGLLEITCDSGAKVVLQGPVTYEAESAAGGYLAIGRLTAKLEKGSRTKVQRPASELATSQQPLAPHLFAVRTPTAIVTDLGTEFGVEVDQQGNTISHVFQGSVEARRIGVDGLPGKGLRLVANEAVRIEKASPGKGSGLERTVIDSARFVRAEQMARSTQPRDSRSASFRRWKAYSDELRRDPTLLAYYDFQQRSGEPRVLPNVARNSDQTLDGIVENAAWVDGRWHGKHALLFNGPTDYVKIHLPQKTKDLTLAGWFYIFSIDNNPTALLASVGWGKSGQVHWLLVSEGNVVCDIWGLLPQDQAHIQSPRILKPHAFRRWTHLAFVYDHVARAAKFYLDGHAVGDVKIVAAEKDSTQPTMICLGEACIGSWNNSTWANEGSGRSFTGQIDELAIFGRVLTAAEVQRAFDMGRPSGKENTVRSAAK